MSTQETLYHEITHLIEGSKNNALVYVNQTLVLMYRGIGKHIKNHIIEHERASYGDEVIKKIGTKLTQQYGNGYGWRNLFRMMKIYEFFPDQNILSTLSSKYS